jgi:hypothetical protein
VDNLIELKKFIGERPPEKISEYDVGYIEAEAYAAFGVLWRGTAPVKDLRAWVTRRYSERMADAVFPLGEVCT